MCARLNVKRARILERSHKDYNHINVLLTFNAQRRRTGNATKPGPCLVPFSFRSGRKKGSRLTTLTEILKKVTTQADSPLMSLNVA